MAAEILDKTFWKGKKVLVTGHTGFKGGWLSLWLKNLGAQVIGYSLSPPTKPSLFELVRLAEEVISTLGDVRNLTNVQAVMSDYEPEIVFHMAAQPLVRYSYMHPVETYTTNIMGTVNVLEAVRQSETVRIVIVVTSDKCYENNEWMWGYRENDRMGGCDPYSSSKGCAELVTSAYRRSYFSKRGDFEQNPAIATVRAGNVIGGGDWAEDRLIPDIIRAIIDNQPVLIRNPNAIRPWQFVLDPLCGYLILAERLWAQGEKFAGAWNFGPGDVDARPVSWVVELITNLWGEETRWELDRTHDLHEAMVLKLDCSKAKSLLGWSSKLQLSEVLKWTVEWYQGYRQGRNMRKLTEDQISRFESLE